MNTMPPFSKLSSDGMGFPRSRVRTTSGSKCSQIPLPLCQHACARRQAYDLAVKNSKGPLREIRLNWGESVFFLENSTFNQDLKSFCVESHLGGLFSDVFYSWLTTPRRGRCCQQCWPAWRARRGRLAPPAPLGSWRTPRARPGPPRRSGGRLPWPRCSGCGTTRDRPRTRPSPCRGCTAAAGRQRGVIGARRAARCTGGGRAWRRTGVLQ